MKKGFFIGANNPGVILYIFLGLFVLGLGVIGLLGSTLESFGLPMKYGKPMDMILFVVTLVIDASFAFFISRWIWNKAKEESDMPLRKSEIVPTDKRKWADVLTACALLVFLILVAGRINSGKFSIGIGGVIFFALAFLAIIKSYKGETALGIIRRIGRVFLSLTIIIAITAVIIAAFVIPISMYYNNPKNQKYIVSGVIFSLLVVFFIIKGFLRFKRK